MAIVSREKSLHVFSHFSTQLLYFSIIHRIAFFGKKRKIDTFYLEWNMSIAYAKLQTCGGCSSARSALLLRPPHARETVVLHAEFMIHSNYIPLSLYYSHVNSTNSRKKKRSTCEHLLKNRNEGEIIHHKNNNISTLVLVQFSNVDYPGHEPFMKHKITTPFRDKYLPR